MRELRIIDAGRVDARRSQYLWHGIASSMPPDSAPTLSLCQATEPYVCLGYHHPLEEVDRRVCRERGWPVLRRQIGGGPVYLDGDQLLFQLTLPAERAPARVELLYRRFLSPAIEAFRALGVRAAFRGANDIAVGERKISGTGAGRIGEAVTVVGNVIFRFPHQRMVDALSLPTDTMRRECLALMRRYVSSLEAEGAAGITRERAVAALVDAYSRALERQPVESALSEREEQAIRRWEKRSSDPVWLAGPVPIRWSQRRVKICADVWVYFCRDRDLSVELSVVDGHVRRLAVAAPELNGAGDEISLRLTGRPAERAAIARELEPFGDAGSRVATLLAGGLAA